MARAPRRLDRILSGMKGRKILVVGDVMLDHYLWGDVRRISPEAPVPVVEVEQESYRLGGAANVVRNITALGCGAALLSLCGTDASGKILKKMALEAGGDLSGLVNSARRPTTVKMRVMSRQQQIVRADREMVSDCSAAERKLLLTRFEALRAEVDAVIISDYGKGVITAPFLAEIVGWCRAHNLFVAVDPKERHFDLYQGVDVITPNLKEAHAALGIPFSKCNDRQIRELGWALVEKMELPHLLVTLSERGMGLFCRKEQRFTHMPTVARRVFDVTGAGDTVIAVYTAAVCAGATPVEAAEIANHAAGITVAELGTATVSPEVLKRAFREG